MRRLQIPLTNGLAVIKLPQPMTKEDVDLLIGTLDLWREKLDTKQKP